MSNVECRISNFQTFSIRTFQGHILEQEDGKKRWAQVVSELSQC